jgi:hypothetical protein
MSEKELEKQKEIEQLVPELLKLYEEALKITIDLDNRFEEIFQKTWKLYCLKGGAFFHHEDIRIPPDDPIRPVQFLIGLTYMEYLPYVKSSLIVAVETMKKLKKTMDEEDKEPKRESGMKWAQRA